MAEDKLPKELPHWYPTEFGFDLKHHDLGMLIVYAAITLDMQRIGRAKEEDYAVVERLADILRDKSRDLRLCDKPLREYPTIKLFHDMYKPGEQNMKKLSEMFAEKLISRSEELRIAKKLSPEKLEDLSEFCCNLSRKVSQYWAVENPDGFKRYLAA